MPYPRTTEELAKRTYAIKELDRPTGKLYEIYDRRYIFIEITIEPLVKELRKEMARQGKVILDHWDAWRGGRTNEPGKTFWYGEARELEASYGVSEQGEVS